MKTTRRNFLKAGVTMAGAASGVSTANEVVFSSDASTGQAAPPTTPKADMLYRTLGHTGAQVSALGVGGHHLGDVPTVDEAIRLVHEAIDAGITFFDNCWEYYNGKTENILGRAIKGRRDQIFLMTKVWSLLEVGITTAVGIATAAHLETTKIRIGIVSRALGFVFLFDEDAAIDGGLSHAEKVRKA